MYVLGMNALMPMSTCASGVVALGSFFSCRVASSSNWQYISYPTVAMWPDCSGPRMLPLPRISRSRMAILKPAPRWLYSSIAFNRDGDRYAAVGSPGSSRGAAYAGAVQLFRRDLNWAFQHERFSLPQHAASEPGQRGFGASVSFERTGTLLAIGAPGVAVDGKAGAGVVHLVRRSGTTWSDEITLEEWGQRGAGARFKEWFALRWEYLL